MSNDKVWVLKDAKPCHLCGGEMVLDTVALPERPEGRVKCLSCEHSFPVTFGEKRDEPESKCGGCRWLGFSHHGPTSTWCDHDEGSRNVIDQPPTYTTDATSCPHYEAWKRLPDNVIPLPNDDDPSTFVHECDICGSPTFSSPEVCEDCWRNKGIECPDCGDIYIGTTECPTCARLSNNPVVYLPTPEDT